MGVFFLRISIYKGHYNMAGRRKKKWIKKEIFYKIRRESETIPAKKTNNIIIYFAHIRSGGHAVSNFIYNLYEGPKFQMSGQFGENIYYRSGNKFSEEYILHNPNSNMAILYFVETSLHQDYSKPHLKNWDMWFGQYDNIYYVVNLRDPFNMVASRFQRASCSRGWHSVDVIEKLEGDKRHDINLALSTWKMYAKEFLGETDYLPKNKIFVNYNKWCEEKEYRNSLADQLGVQFKDDGWDKRSIEGGGSSFGKYKKYKSGNKKLITRWHRHRHYGCVDNLIFNYIFFRDRELTELSERIFGHIDGTEVFLK